MFRFAVFTDRLCSLRVDRAFPLRIPVEHTSRVSHLVIDISRSAHTLGDISSVGSNLGSDDSLFYIIDIRKRKMLCRSDIAEESSACGRGNGTTDRSGDMVISRSNICNERP